MSSFALIRSSSAASRLAAARAFVTAHAGDGVLVVGASRAAADELAWSVAARSGALVDVTRMSFAELATKLALPVLAERLATPASPLGLEAMVARVTFDAVDAGDLRYFTPVADLPGFPRAAARTLHELQQAGVPREALREVDRVGPDLAALAARLDEQIGRSGAIGRADVLATATARLSADPRALPARAVVLVDVAVTTAVERRLLAAIAAAAGTLLAVVPTGDVPTIAACRAAGAIERASDADEAAADASARARLQSWLFAPEPPPEGGLDDTVRVFSAPGEGREAVEISRRVLQEADAGVPFDEMAVLLRAPQTYLGLLEHAFARADVPAWFERGTRRPDPDG